MTELDESLIIYLTLHRDNFKKTSYILFLFYFASPNSSQSLTTSIPIYVLFLSQKIKSLDTKQDPQRQKNTKTITKKDTPHTPHPTNKTVVNYFWTWGLSWNDVDVSSFMPLVKTDFFSITVITNCK